MTEDTQSATETEEVAEINEAEQEKNNKIRDAFDTALAAEKEDDDIKMAMIGGGATFKSVTRLYNQFMIDSGLAISKADRNQIVTDCLEGCDFDDEESFGVAVKAIVESVKGATERSAGSLIRAYAKKNSQEVWVKPKAETTRSGFLSGYYDFLRTNPTCSKEEAKAFINGTGDYSDTSDNVKRQEIKHLSTWKLVTTVAMSYIKDEKPKAA